MSKKKKKKTVARKKPGKLVRRAKMRLASSSLDAPSNRTAAATIFVYNVDGVACVRTSPQRVGAGPGFLEWTVVNLASDQPVDVDITWQDTDPWGGKTPIKIKNGNIRIHMAGAKDGIYKYNVSANGATEDPEIEIPGN